MDVRCACGQVYHAEPSHAGRRIRCRCGRTVVVPVAPVPGRRRRISVPRVRLPHPRLRPWVRPALALAAWGYLAGVVAAGALLWGLGDRWWLATMFLFGHRWLVLVPAVPLAVAVLVVRPRLVAVVGAGVLVALGPVMGFRTGWRGWFRGTATAELRVATFNVDGGRNRRLDEIPGRLQALGADVMLFQECADALITAAGRLEGWTVWRGRGGLCLASRFPIDSTEAMEEFEAGGVGTIGNVAFHRVVLPDGPLRLGLVHLETPRSGLERLRYGAERAQLRRNMLLRDAGSSRASRWLAERGAQVIGGDFNLPVESRIYRRHWTRCANAFSRMGRGFGYTRVLYRFSARIDQVLTCADWRPVRAEVGPALGSDHLPVIVDLARQRSPAP